MHIWYDYIYHFLRGVFTIPKYVEVCPDKFGMELNAKPSYSCYDCNGASREISTVLFLYLIIFIEKDMSMKITRINENELNRLVERAVRRLQRESREEQAPRLRTYGLSPNQERVAEEITLRNKRTVNNCEIRYANEYAREWMQTSEDEGERRFISQCLNDGLDIYEFLDGWQTIGLVAF